MSALRVVVECLEEELPVVVQHAARHPCLGVGLRAHHLEQEIRDVVHHQRAGAEAVQLFDSWAGILDETTYRDLALPAARRALAVDGAPRIYFAPHAPHLLAAQREVDADAHGVDWRVPIDTAWLAIGRDRAIQGNLDPAVLLTDEQAIRRATTALLEATSGTPGPASSRGIS